MRKVSEKALDEAIARFVLKAHMATLEQVKDAIDSQAMIAEHRVHLPLAEALVRLGVITPAQRAHVEDLVKTQNTEVIEHLGNYKIIKKLGEGKMGSVYLAEDTGALRNVALKLLPSRLAENKELLMRFKQEAKLTGKLSHLNIVAAYDMGEQDGQHFYVMEYCEGESLGRILSREKRLSYDKALDVVLQVASGLQHAHNHGIIHRDIKPDNIILTPDGTAKILDMGLAKSLGPVGEAYNTQSGVTVGTPHYMSPEQARGVSELDGRADIYGLGATLYHLVTGQTPFSGSLTEVLNKHIMDEVRNPQDLNENISDSVVHLISKMMAKMPEDRYLNCDQLAADVELVLAGKLPTTPAPEAGKSSVASKAVQMKKSTSDVTHQAIKNLPPRPQPDKRATSDAAHAVVRNTSARALLAIRMERAERTEKQERSEKADNTQEKSERPERGDLRRRQKLLRQGMQNGRHLFIAAVVILLAVLGALFYYYQNAQENERATTSAEPGFRVGNVVNLLSLIDPERDRVNGRWKFQENTLIGDPDGQSQGIRLEIPYLPPAEYNFRMSFTRTRSEGDVTQILAAAEKQFAWKMGAYSNTLCAFELVNGKEGSQNPTNARFPGIVNARKYESVVQVRKTGVKAFLNGVLISKWDTDYSDLSNPAIWKLREAKSLGIGTWESIVEFDVLEVTEVSGRGRLQRDGQPDSK